MDISKRIDKKGGNDYSKQFAVDLKQARESRNLTMKYCDDKYCNGSTNWSWYEGRKDGCRVPNYQTYLEIIKDFPELEKYKELIKEAEREVIGTKKGVGCFNNDEHYTVGGTKANDIDVTAPSTNLAKQWQGWGTALKPSYESIIVARKPFKGSLVDNVIQYGVGGINIDECRVGNEEMKAQISGKTSRAFQSEATTTAGGKGIDHIGRFPANTILTYDETDFDEVCGEFPKDNKGNSNARYFYCAKASKRDRDEGLDNQEEVKVNDGRQTPIDNPFQRGETPRRNGHPTVKPTNLMQYLVRLVSPNGATILDPFNGSGSTGKAVMYENKDRKKNYKYIGIELSEEYLRISKARIEYVINLKEENKIDKSQITIDELMEVKYGKQSNS